MFDETQRPTKADIIEYIKSTDLFGHLDNETIEKLSTHGQRVTLKKGEVLFRLGDIADAVYIVSNGLLQVSAVLEKECLDALQENCPEKVVGEIKPFEIAGEIQILTMGKRTATITAIQNTELIKFSRVSFSELSETLPGFIHTINRIINERLLKNRLSEILPGLFGNIEKNNLQAIKKMAEWVHIKRGEVLFRQGDRADSFYIIITGRLGGFIKNSDIEDDCTSHRISDMYRGESVGELAILSDENRTATIYALRDSELARFSKEDFYNLLEQYPKLLMQITKMTINRLKKANISSNSTKECTVFAVVPVNSSENLKEFIKSLTMHLSYIGSTLCIDGEVLDDFMGTPGISRISTDDLNSIRISSWLNLQEERYRFILMETDKSPSNWTKRCIRQADQVLVVADAGAESGMNAIEEEFLYTKDCISGLSYRLILLHGDGKTPPRGTQKWLDKRDVEMHHHVRMDNESDFKSLARFLSGTAVGVALGGGGARGFSHIGAIRALKEEGVPIDIIGGTSIGSIMGALYAIGLDYKSMAQLTTHDIKMIIRDFTFPVLSLFAGRGFVNELKGFFGDIHIEDLWAPYFCVSSNLTRAEVSIHRTGPLWKAVQASNAAPGIFPPVVMNGDLLVDGAFLSNLPADVLRSLFHGRVIAIDVSPPVDLAENYSYGDSVSGWKIIRKKLNPFAKKIAVPTIMSVLARAGELAGIAHQRRTIKETADLYLRPPVEKYNLHDYGLATEIIETGYNFVKEKIKIWKSHWPA